MRTEVILVMILSTLVRTGFAQCPPTTNPPGYWGDGTGEASIVCGVDASEGESTRVDVSLTRGTSKHITSIPVGTTNFEITMYATSDVDTLLMKGCSNGKCPSTNGIEISSGSWTGSPNYGQCIAGYACENYCGWSK